MPLTMYLAAVPVYTRILTALSATLDKAAAHAAAIKVEPSVLLEARLYPNMWSVTDQVRAACSHATRGPARITGLPIPSLDAKETTVDALKARIAWALAFLASLTPAQFEGTDEREVVFPSGNGEVRMLGRDYLLGFSMPNFYFHATTAYDILRHNGVPLVKDDFIGVA